MKHLLSLVLFAGLLACAAPANAQSDKWGIGLRFGSPTAFNVKRYMSERNALDINVGSGFIGLYDNRYGVYRGLGFSAMVNYLWRQDIDGAPGLELYYGVGGLLSVRSYRYYDGRDERYRSNVGLGATGAIGLEYFIPKAPISLFVELNPYVEIVPAPLYISLLGGIGGRFVF